MKYTHPWRDSSISSTKILHHTREQRFKAAFMKTTVQFSPSVMSNTFVTPWTIAHKAFLSITKSQSLLKLMSIGFVKPSTISSSVVPFSSCLQFFPASGSFPMSHFITSVLSINIKDWFPLGLIAWISSQSKGLSRVFPDTTVQKHQFFST